MDELLKDCTFKNTPAYIPKITNGKVIKCYDGDTITIATIIDEFPCRFSVRINGLDTPELRTKNLEEKECGYFVRDYVTGLINGKMVRIEDISYDKYGRILARVFFIDSEKNEVCLNDILLEKKYAVPYDGGTKGKTNWKEYMGLEEPDKKEEPDNS
jgi:endonuclease YncB( thermonuclease family)